MVFDEARVYFVIDMGRCGGCLGSWMVVFPTVLDSEGEGGRSTEGEATGNGGFSEMWVF